MTRTRPRPGPLSSLGLALAAPCLFALLTACRAPVDPPELEKADGSAPLAGAVEPAAQEQLEELASQLSGSFSSARQAAQSEAFRDIRLEVVPIWTEREDGPWLYVEQAAADSLARPYRQRVYRLRALGEGVFESRVYTLEDEAGAVGAWRQDEPLAGRGPEELEARKGCSVLLRRTPAGTFHGSTLGTSCPSSLFGATYATSVVTVGPESLVSWDRGYDAEHVQVWGAEEGPYVFDRVERDEKKTEGAKAGG